MPGQISVRGILGHKVFQFKNAPRVEDWLEVKEGVASSLDVPDDAGPTCCSTKSDWSPLYVPNEVPKNREFYQLGLENDSLLSTTIEQLSMEGMQSSFWIGKRRDKLFE